MDHTHSELTVGNPGRLINDLGRAINGNRQVAVRILTQNAQLFEHLERFLALVLDTAKEPPRDEIHTAVDNSTSDSMESDPTISNDVHDLNIDESGCTTLTATTPPSQAALVRWPALSPQMVLPTPMNCRNKSALVIEYNQSLSRMFTAFLKSDHYLVRTAYKSEDALRLYRDCGPFEVVLIDHGMPTRNGVDIALDILKEHPTQPMMVIASDYQSEDEVPRRNELMRVPFLLNMSNSHFRKVLEGLQPWATRPEVDSAVGALTTAELLRLKQFGEGRVRFSQGADYRTGEDLLQEALRLTLEGNRRWNKRVSFETYLTGVIKSISRRRKGDCVTDGEEFCVLDNFAGNNRAADEHLIAKEQVAEVFAEFKDDMEATQVIQGWLDGLKKSGIMQNYALSESRYRGAVKRIRTKLLRPTNGGGEVEKHDRQD